MIQHWDTILGIIRDHRPETVMPSTIADTLRISRGHAGRLLLDLCRRGFIEPVKGGFVERGRAWEFEEWGEGEV